MPNPPDPVSQVFDAEAARIIRRMYLLPAGRGVRTRLPDPSPRLVERFATLGIDITGPDDVPGRRARTRWARAFMRAAFRANKAHGRERSLTIDVGNRAPALGVIPAGRVIRLALMPSGAPARAYMDAVPDSDKAFDSAGNPAGRWADPVRR